MPSLAEEARLIYTRLQSDPEFEHCGADSRGISLPTDIVLNELDTLQNDTIDPHAQQFLMIASSILRLLGENGVYVRIKNGTNIVIRGTADNLPEHPSLQELNVAILRRRNNIEITCSGDEGDVRINTYAAEDTATIKETFDSVTDQIPPQAKYAMAKGILGIINDQLDQIFEA